MSLLSLEPRTRTDARKADEADTLGGALRLFYRFPVPWLLTVQLVAVGSLRLWLGAWTGWDLLIAAAIAVYWPLQEWAAHVFLLHFKPVTVLGVRIDPFAARAHRWHHRHPHVLERVFVPTRVILALIPIHAAAWWLAMPTAELALSGMTFFTLATLIYEWTHFMAHARYAPGTSWFQRVRKNHRLHHFMNERYWHAFTVPHVDTLLGTDPQVAEVDKSPTVRTLGVDEAA